MPFVRAYSLNGACSQVALITCSAASRIHRRLAGIQASVYFANVFIIVVAEGLADLVAGKVQVLGHPYLPVKLCRLVSLAVTRVRHGAVRKVRVELFALRFQERVECLFF